VRRFAPAATGTFSFRWRQLIPARIALPSPWKPSQPGKAAGGSFQAPPATLRLLAKIVKQIARKGDGLFCARM
jgi:hypothetical protein